MPLPDNIYSINPGSNEQDASSTTANSKNQTLVADGMTKANLLQQFRSTMDLFLQQEGRHEKGLVALLQLFTSTGFYELLPFNQTMMLRLATNSLGVTPAQPNDFQCRFFGATKYQAPILLQQAFSRREYGYNLSSRAIASILHLGDIAAPHREMHLHLSLMMLMPPSPKWRDIAAENLLLETNKNISREAVDEMFNPNFTFPESLEEFTRGVERYAILFDIFANVASTDDVTSLVGSRLRAFAKDLGFQRSKINLGLAQDVDYLANLCNAVDAIINAHMVDCRDQTNYDMSRLDELQKLVVRLNTHKQFLHSQSTIDCLPSRRTQAANDKKRNQQQANVAATVNSSSKKRQKIAVDGTSGSPKCSIALIYKNVKLPAPFRDIFPAECFVRCPTVLKNGKPTPICLHFFIKGKCSLRKCKKSHNKPSQLALVHLKEFVESQVDAFNRKSIRPAPAV